MEVIKRMAYKKGDAKINKGFFVGQDEPYNTNLGEVYLPHSCDEWNIGGKDEVKLLIEDLQELLKEM